MCVQYYANTQEAHEARNIVNAIPIIIIVNAQAALSVLYSHYILCRLVSFAHFIAIYIVCKHKELWRAEARRAMRKCVQKPSLPPSPPDGSINFHLGYSFFSVFFHIIFFPFTFAIFTIVHAAIDIIALLQVLLVWGDQYILYERV